MNKTARIATLLAAVLLGTLGGAAAGQEASPSAQAPGATATGQPAAQKSKAKKVWTNDSIAEVRQPGDAYPKEKESAENRAKTAGGVPPSVQPDAQPPQPGVAPPVTLKIPKTAEEAKAEIAQAQGMLDNFQNLFDAAKERISTETDPMVRATLEQKMQLLQGDVDSTAADIKTLEKKLEELNGKQRPRAQTPGSSQPQ